MEADKASDNEQTKYRPAVTAIVGMLLLLVLMIWVPVSAVGAHERASGLAGPGTGTVQATPTEDATVTVLNKEKLAQEVQQLKNQNEPDLLGWLRTNAAIHLSTLVVVIGGLIGLWRWLVDRRSEREKRDEDRFQTVVAGLGSDNIGVRVGAAIMLRTFLQPGYERFYRQAFDLAVAHLRLRKPDLETKDNPEAPVLASLNQALVVVFKEAFPRAREWIKQGSPSSRLQRIKAWLTGKAGIIAWLKRKLGREERFKPQSLDATGIQLDKAYLWMADLKQVFMPWASLRETDLTEANLAEAKLYGGDHKADLRKVKLRKADLSRADLGAADLSDEADLSEANLTGAKLCGAYLHKAKLWEANLTEAELWGNDCGWPADLSEANLTKAKLRRADLRKAKLWRADLSEADLSGADLSEVRDLEYAQSLKDTNLYGVKGLTKEQLEACETKGAIIDARAQSALPAQGSTPTPDAGGSSAASSGPDPQS